MSVRSTVVSASDAPTTALRLRSWRQFPDRIFTQLEGLILFSCSSSTPCFPSETCKRMTSILETSLFPRIGRHVLSLSPSRGGAQACTTKGIHHISCNASPSTLRQRPVLFQPRGITPAIGHARWFHVTPRRDAACFPILSFLKVSLARMLRATLAVEDMHSRRRCRLRCRSRRPPAALP